LHHPPRLTQNVAHAAGAAGASKYTQLLEAKESSASQLRRDPADPRDISPTHLATGCGKPERLLLYRREANSTRHHGLDDPLPTELGKHDIRRGHPPVSTPNHGTPDHRVELAHVSRPLVSRQNRQGLIGEPIYVQTGTGLQVRLLSKVIDQNLDVLSAIP